MKWLLRLYPARWRARYGDEFAAVLATQRTSVGLFVDVLGGAVEAHLHPQIQYSSSTPVQGEDTMTLAMFQRCAVGGPKLSPAERRIAYWLSIGTALVIAMLYLVLTKIYREAPAVQALYWSSIFFPNFIYQQTVYLKRRFWLTQALVLAAGFSTMYFFMLAVCVLAHRL
jgi:hypothetical protein